MKLLRSITFLAVLAALLGAVFVHPAAAQADGLTLRVKPANDGYVKNGEWLTVWAELENKGKNIEGQLSVQVTGSSTLVTYAVPVSLPSGARKRLPLYILPNNYSRELEVQLTEQGKPLAKEKFSVHPQVNLTYQVGLVAAERGGLALLNGITLPGQERSKVILDVALDDLPDRSEGLSSFDLLVFNDTDTSRLTPAQAGALANWVRQGGQLVVGGGTGAAVTLAGFPAGLLPVSLSGEVELQADDLSGLVEYAKGSAIRTTGTFVFAQVSLAAQAQVIAGSTEMPLVVESSYGDGKVDFVSLSLSSAPFNSWPDTIRFWNELLASRGTYPQNLPADISMRQMVGMNMLNNLTNIPTLDLPSIRWLSILLGIYILLVGPVNYFVLRRLRRLQLAWVTIPILTLLFSAGAFGMGYLTRGSDLILNQIALIYPDGNGAASVKNYLGLFSPSQQSYALAVKTPGLLSAISQYNDNGWGPGGMATNTANATFIQGDQPRIEGLTVDQWSFQAFAEEEGWEKFGRVRGDLRLENEKIIGTVRNETSVAMTDTFLVAGPYFVRSGDLAPGEEKKVEISLSTLPVNRFGPPLSYRLYENEFQTPNKNTRLIDLKRSILSAVIDGQMSGMSAKMFGFAIPAPTATALVSDLSVTFLGWVNQAPPDVTVEGYGLKKQVLGLVTQKMGYQMGASNEIAIPVGMVPGRVSKAPTSGGVCGGGDTTTGVALENGTAEFTFQIRDLSGYAPQEIRLSLTIDGGTPSGAPEIAMYAWKEESWAVLKGINLGVNVINDVQSFINPDGEVKVRIASDAALRGFCMYVDLGLKAEKTAQIGGPDASH